MIRYAVFRTDKIGDLVVSLPVAEAIKEGDPGAAVTFVTSPRTAEIARACPFIDGVLEHDENVRSLRAVRDLARKVRSARPDVAVFLRPTLTAALATLAAGVPTRVGTAYRYFSPLFTKRVREHRRYATKHELDYNLGILAAVLRPPARTYLPRIVVPETSEQYAREALAERGLARKSFAIVHPGSARSARNFPIGAYAALADFLECDLGVRVLVTGADPEAGLIAEMASHRRTRSLTLVGAPGLLHLTAVIGEACLLISGSTGPMHLAGAVGTPTVSFFSPVRSTSPRRWRALGPRAEVILPPVPECPTCVGKDCKYFDCMDRIPMDAAKEAVRRALETCR